MIRVCARRVGGGLDISAVGHADYAEHGRDIVCAAVSALLMAYLSHLTTRLSSAEAGEADAMYAPIGGDSGDRRATGWASGTPSVVYRMGEGSLWIRTRDTDHAETAAWAVTRAGLGLIARAYPAHLTFDDCS